MLDQCVFLQNGLELLEGIEQSRQSEDPGNTGISSWDHLLFTNNSAMFELTNAERTRKHRCQNFEFNYSVFWRTKRSCRSNLIILFETSKECRSYSPGSTSIHVRMWSGIVTVGEDDLGNDVCFGLALAVGVSALAPISSLWFSCISSNISVTYLFNSFPIIIQISIQQRPWWKLTVTSSTGPFFVFPRIHPFTLDDWSSRSNVFSRHEPSNFASSASSGVTKYCPRETVFRKSASEHNLINRRSSGRFAKFRLYSRRKSHRACSLVRSGLVVVDKSVGATMVSDLS